MVQGVRIIDIFGVWVITRGTPLSIIVKFFPDKNVLIGGQIIYRAVHSWATIVSVSERAEIVVVVLASRQSVSVRTCVSVCLCVTSLMCLVAGSTMLARYLTLFLLSLLLLCILPGTFLFHVLLRSFDVRVLGFYISAVV